MGEGGRGGRTFWCRWQCGFETGINAYQAENMEGRVKARGFPGRGYTMYKKGRCPRPHSIFKSHCVLLECKGQWKTGRK